MDVNYMSQYKEINNKNVIPINRNIFYSGFIQQ